MKTATGKQGGQIHTFRLAGQYLGGGGVSQCVCAVVKLPSRLLADLGLSQCVVMQTQLVPRLSPVSALMAGAEG